MSEDLHAIIGRRPHALVRRGGYILIGIVSTLIALGWLVPMPGRLPATAVLRTASTPAVLRAGASGRVLRLLVQEGDTVRRGAVLAYLESNASYNEVMELQHWLDAALAVPSDSFLIVIHAQPLPALPHLGELQASYRNLLLQYNDARELLNGGYYRAKRAALQADLARINGRQGSVDRDYDLSVQDRALQEKQYRSYETLAREKVIAPLELNVYKSRLIGREQAVHHAGEARAALDAERLDKQRQLLDLQHAMNEAQELLRAALLDLRAGIGAWTDRYVLTAPESGRVLFNTGIREQDLVNEGQSLLTIEPPAGSYYAELSVAQAGLGKVIAGQTVFIRIDSYPEAEFGRLRGQVASVSGLPGRGDSFLVRTKLPDGLRTNRGILLPFRQGLTARAEIRTADTKLIDRLLQPLLHPND